MNKVTGAAQYTGDFSAPGLYIGFIEAFISSEEKIKLVNDAREEALFMELYKPRERLYIFGAGTDVEPLVKIVSKLDFLVCLIDPRPARCNKDNFPTVEELIIEFPHVYIQQNDLPLNSFVIIMTHITDCIYI